MEPEGFDPRQYVEVLIRYWKWIVGGALVAAATAFAVSFLTPPTYEATALVAVTESRYVIQLDSRIKTVEDIQPAQATYTELATSDGLLQSLLAQLDPLPEGVETVNDLQGMVEATSGIDPSMMRLVVRSRNPQGAARVANAWAELYVEQASEVYGDPGSEEQALFFEGQLERVEAELEAAEGALIVFQGNSQAAILEAQLASAQQDLLDYLAEQREIKRVVRNARALQARIAGQPRGVRVSPGDDLAALLLQIQAFSVRTSRPVQTLSYDVGEYTQRDDSPPIQLQVSDAALLSSERTASELVVFLEELVAMLEARGEEIEAQVAALEPQIPTLQQQLEEAETERRRLIRARDVAQEIYVLLARKVAEARFAAQDMSAKVRLVSRAASPGKPMSPRRLFNTAGAGTVGLMLGVFGAFAVAWWRGGETAQVRRREEREGKKA